MLIRLIGLAFVVASALVVFFAKHILSFIIKREASEREIIMLKAAGLLAVFFGTCSLILPDLF